jgi:hypothetical protein
MKPMDAVMILCTKHDASEQPKEREEIYIFTRDNQILQAEFIDGKFWPDHCSTIPVNDILFWANTDIKFAS